MSGIEVAEELDLEGIAWGEVGLCIYEGFRCWSEKMQRKAIQLVNPMMKR